MPPSAAAHKDHLVQELFARYEAHPEDMPFEWAVGLSGASATVRARRIADFIAGMTDRYAIRQYRDLIGPAGLPEGF